ncbi:MAG: ABC transporter permease [Spirochaetales bacterium]|nr:ABC transporter permease [Spirochaetales bacterium]
MNYSEFSLPLLHNAVDIMTPVLLAATGGLFTELTGVLNIALEGLMLIGAFFCIVFAIATGNLFLGILLGVTVSILVASLMGVITFKLKANIFITGLATNLFASGFTVFFSSQVFGTKGVLRFAGQPLLPRLDHGFLGSIPVFGEVFTGHNFFVYLSWILIFLAVFLIYRTPFGLRLRATGKNPEVICALGLKPMHYRFYGILISGFTCGLGGGFLSLRLNAFVPEITAGRGWIALVAIYLGNKTPVGILGAAFILGIAESISIYIQGIINIPADFVLAFPYIMTVIALIVYSIFKYYHSPENNKGEG